MDRQDKIDKLKKISTPEGPDAKWRRIAERNRAMSEKEFEAWFEKQINEIKEKRKQNL